MVPVVVQYGDSGWWSQLRWMVELRCRLWCSVVSVGADWVSVAFPDPHQSPLSSATDRFLSPVTPSTARRRLFVGPRGTGGHPRAITEGQ